MRGFHFISAKYAMNALSSQELKVSRFDDLNDPFELYGAELSNPDHRVKFRAFKRWASQKFGLLCFSRRWRNPLLWSHYGDRHRGVAIEFDIDDDAVADIEYSPYRLRLDIEKKVASGGFSEDDAYRMATTKSKHWMYEEEVRVFVELAKCRVVGGLHFEPLDDALKMVGLVLGPLCELTLRDIERSLARGRRVQVTHARLAFKSFNVVRNKSKPVRVVHGAA